jgi:predicted transcriptional regulator
MKSRLINLAGSQTNLAKLFGITTSAVAQWEEEIPELRVFQLKELRPEWFTQEGSIVSTGTSTGRS